MCCMQRNILLVNTYTFGVNKFLVYKGSQLMIYCRYAQDYKWLQFACEEDCSCSFRWHHLTAVPFSSTELCVTTNRIWNRKVFDFPIVWWNMMLIAQVRVMFDSQGQWSKSGEEHITTIVYIWKFFPHIVSRNHVLCYMMLRMGCSGLWTGCKSGSRRSFLHADNKMVWVLNRMWVRVWKVICAWHWQWAAMGFGQHVSHGPEGFFSFCW